MRLSPLRLQSRKLSVVEDVEGSVDSSEIVPEAGSPCCELFVRAEVRFPIHAAVRSSSGEV